MTNCCDDYGQCTRGKDCPARPAMLIEKNSDGSNPDAHSNPPWDWIDRLGFWWACVLTGVAIGFGWGLGRLLKLF